MTKKAFKEKRKLLKVSRWQINPKDYADIDERLAFPVLRKDLGPGLMTTALRTFPLDEKGYASFWKERLNLYTKTYDFGKALWLRYSFTQAKNFKEILEEIAQRGLYIFDIWGYGPSSAYEHLVPEEVHQLLLEKLGYRFLGWDNGEQDGRYVGSYAQLVCPAPSDRKEAFERFSQYFQRLGNHNKNYLNVLASLTYLHYFAHFGNHRLLGAETAQALPSVPMWYAFIRGAGKQYGILWFGNASIFNRWGYKEYYGPIKEFKEGANIGYGPNYGTSLNLLKRLWYVEVMYGSVLMSFEQNHILGDNWELLFTGRNKLDRKFYSSKPPLTPIGELQLDCTSFCKRHPDLGVQYTPVALIFDFYTGWTPPRHLYGDPNYPYLVWGNTPYSKGDHQIDLFFREIFPGYEDAGFYQDERGFLTSTPYGDIFDVLLSNVTEDVLNQYSVAIVLGEILIAGKIKRRLKQFVKNGGTLILFANQVKEKDKEFYGWEKKNKIPLIFKNSFGNGLVITIGAEYGLANNPDYPGYRENIITGKWPWSPEKTEKPLSSPYKWLRGIWKAISPILKELSPIKVEGSPIQFITNITNNPNRFYLLLSNNEAKEATIHLSAARGKLRRVHNLFTDRDTLIVDDGTSWLHIPPLDLVILEIETEKPCIEFLPEPKKPIKVDKEIETNYQRKRAFSLSEEIKLASQYNTCLGLRYSKVANLKNREILVFKEEARKNKVKIRSLYLVSDQTPYLQPDIGNIIPHNEEEVKEFLCSVIRLSLQLEIEEIVLSGGWRFSDFKKRFQRTIERLRLFSQMANEKQIKVVLVPHHLRIGNSSREVREIITKVDCPNFSAALDIGHTILAGENLLEEVLNLKEVLSCIYLNSCAVDSINKAPLDLHLPPKGNLKEKELINLQEVLQKIRFKGYLSFNVAAPRTNKKELRGNIEFIRKLFPNYSLELCLL